MTTNRDSSFLETIGASVLALPLLALLAPLMLGSAFLNTWVGLTLWGWFAPWPSPVTWTQAAGLYLAWRLVTSNPTQAKDERTGYEKAVAGFASIVVVPLLTLSAGWVLHWWTR